MQKFTPQQPALSLFEGKVCSCCRLWQPLSQYNRKPDKPDGLFYTCKTCCLQKQRERRQKERESRPPKPNPLSPTGGKECKDCQKWKPYDEYYKNSHNGDGYMGYCKPCSLLRNRKWNKKVGAAYWRQAYRRTYQRNPEKARVRSREWTKKNPEYNRLRAHRRRTLKNSSSGTYTVQQWKELCAKYDNRCLRCGKKKPLTVDHVVPLSQGGSNDISNLQPLCKPCNSAKHVARTDYRTSWQIIP